MHQSPVTAGRCYWLGRRTPRTLSLLPIRGHQIKAAGRFNSPASCPWPQPALRTNDRQVRIPVPLRVEAKSPRLTPHSRRCAVNRLLWLSVSDKEVGLILDLLLRGAVTTAAADNDEMMVVLIAQFLVCMLSQSQVSDSARGQKEKTVVTSFFLYEVITTHTWMSWKVSILWTHVQLRNRLPDSEKQSQSLIVTFIASLHMWWYHLCFTYLHFPITKY